eukprot:jgi/Picsp_1/1482/NSC_04960-R1_protein
MSSWKDKRTKVVARHLPPEWNEDTFRQVAGEWMDRCDWFRFVEGKDAIRKKDATEDPSLGNVLSRRRRIVMSVVGYSRAYLRFRKAENVCGFKEYFEAQAKSFSSKEHRNSIVDDDLPSKDYDLGIVVQYAPYQTVSCDKDAPKKNTWQSSLEKDEEFQAFREGLLREDGKGGGDESNKKVYDSSRAVILNSKSNQEVAEGKPKETALMKYVTQLHRKKAQEKAPKRDGTTKSARRSKNKSVAVRKKVEAIANDVSKLSKKKQQNQSSGTAKNKDQNGGKSGAKGKQLAEVGSERLQPKKKDKVKQKEKKDSQKRQDSTSSVERKSIVKQMPKNAASSARALKSPSKPPVSILHKPKEMNVVSTSTEKNNNAQGGNKAVKFKILTRKEGDGNVDKSNQPQIPPEPPKASTKSIATETVKTNVHSHKVKPPNDKNKITGDSEGDQSNQGKGRQRRRGPRRKKKNDA